MADAVTALAELLKADAGVAGLAGTRVFGGELPEAETAEMPRHAIVVTPSGGISLTGGSYAEHDTRRIDLFAYGATPQEAFELGEKAALALRRARRKVWAGVLIHSVKPAGGLSLGRDSALAWPRAFQPYQVFHSLEEV